VAPRLLAFGIESLSPSLKIGPRLFHPFPAEKRAMFFFCVSPYFLNKVKAALISPAGEKWATLIKIGPGHTH
jgi:hypothetical protein